MQAKNDFTRTEHGAPKSDTMGEAHRIAEEILADLERTGKQAQADRLAEILLLLADGVPLTDPLPALRTVG